MKNLKAKVGEGHYKCVMSFFNNIFGIDISEVEIDFTSYIGRGDYGEYRPSIKSYVAIKDGMTITDTMVNIIHEITHLCQFEHEVGFCIDSTIMGKELGEAPEYCTIHAYNKVLGIADDDYANNILEIDARLSSFAYLFLNVGGEKAWESLHNTILYPGIKKEILRQRISAIFIEDCRDFLFSKMEGFYENI